MTEPGTIGAIPLDNMDLVAAAGLVLVAGLVSVGLKLGLGRRLLVASLRTVVQLILLGLVLEWIFEIDQAMPLFCLLGLMLVFAGKAAVDRSERSFAGALSHATVTLGLTGMVTAYIVTAGIVGVQPWYEPQYLLPVLGMILGNSLTGISLCLDKLLDDLSVRRALVDADLAMGATRWEAARGPVAAAVTRGMVPIINAMTVVGIVSLPGMMTGQILAGADPMDAVKYQVVVMFMLAASTALGCVGVALAGYRRLFNKRHQLRAELIRHSG